MGRLGATSLQSAHVTSLCSVMPAYGRAMARGCGVGARYRRRMIARRDSPLLPSSPGGVPNPDNSSTPEPRKPHLGPGRTGTGTAPRALGGETGSSATADPASPPLDRNESIRSELRQYLGSAQAQAPAAAAVTVLQPITWLSWVTRDPEQQHGINSNLNLLLALAFVSCLAAKLLLVDADHWGQLSVLEIVQQLPSSNWRDYDNAVNSNPMLTKACISGVVYTLGDCSAQVYEGRSLDAFDRARILRSGLCGFIAHGPLSHLYYQNLDYLFSSVLQVDSQSAYLPFIKLGIDQTIWSLFWNSLYYVLLGIFKFESPAVIIQTVRSSWWDLLKAGWRLWPFAHVITYGVIPVQHRLLWVDAVELVWVTILSVYGQQRREELARQAAAAGVQGQPVTQVAVALPGADGKGGDPAEEILRSMQAEGQVLMQDAEGRVTTVDLQTLYASRPAGAAADEGRNDDRSQR